MCCIVVPVRCLRAKRCILHRTQHSGYAVKKASNRSVEREGVTSKFQDAKKKTQGSTKTSANPSVALDDAAVFVAGQMFWPNESKNQLQEMVAKETGPPSHVA